MRSVATGDTSTMLFDLDNANVDADTLVVKVGGTVTAAVLSPGTGTNGVDQIAFDDAPAASAITASYKVKATTTGACILATAEATTATGGNVTANGYIEGNLKASMVVDSNGVAVDDVFKTALPKVRFE